MSDNETQSYKRSVVVLLADDNPADQEIARRVLGAGVFRCELYMANDGVEALDYLTRTFEDPDTHPRPDLMLLDINMPRKSGDGCAQTCQRQRGLAENPGADADNLGIGP